MSENEGPKTTVDVDATGRGPMVRGAVGIEFPGTDESITITVTVADKGDDEANKKAATQPSNAVGPTLRSRSGTALKV
jgi:hypothetical protein